MCHDRTNDEPGQADLGSGVVDAVVANPQPHHDRFACDLGQAE
jgi:hypothetical protein